MRLRAEREASLPRLAWIARLSGSGATVVCGPYVELAEEWISEAVWDGEFEEGGFHRTPAVFGSGVRLRDDDVRFVTSAGLVDRVWYYRSAEMQAVGNSLPLLLASTGDRLRADVDYRPFIQNRPTPVGAIETAASTRDGELTAVYWNHIAWDGDDARVVARPSTPEAFPDFAAYRDFLYDAVRRIVANASDEARQRPLSLLTTISRGYDSPAVSLLARGAGCRDAATIREARSVLPRDDSGEEIAKRLGLECQVVDRAEKGVHDELAFWAADGRAWDQNLATFDYDRGVTALFSGAYGGVIWGMDRDERHPATSDFADPNTLSFCEFRLRKGVIHCPVPFLGLDRAIDILRISRSPEMKRWSVGGLYDRPIPRRMLREAGVPSSMFARRKSATQFLETFLWPSRPELQASYAKYLGERGEGVALIGLRRFLNFLDTHFLLPLEERSVLSFQGLREWIREPGRRLFNWANNTMAERLSRGRRPVKPSRWESPVERWETTWEAVS